MDNVMTYISLFSSAGVGCYGFKMEGFQCIATNELIQRRLQVQKFNEKCKYDSGYICGDITTEEIKNKIRREFDLWVKKEHISELDVLIATPPCQGMSVANHKKSDMEIVRNSLVVESIKMIREFAPKVFVFENVPAFMKTICTDVDGNDKAIADAIQENLGGIYSYAWRVINFKDYGACSSRSRTLVIGVRKDLSDEISPYEIFPSRKKERTLREVIGSLKALTQFGEISPNDIYHSFRVYPEHMRSWIHDLTEGETAFNNEDPLKRPHQIKNGVVVQNKQKNGDKYRRQIWDKPGPCVHTRNDQLASQNTVHPADDRVFSIRELMMMMTVPHEFKWSKYTLHKLNEMTEGQKTKYLKTEEIKIRQSLGEAVPTEVFRNIAANIKNGLFCRQMSNKEIADLLASDRFSTYELGEEYIRDNPDNLSLNTLMRIAELANTQRTETAAYYTNKSIVTEILNRLPDTTAESIRILEPSVGVGNFIPQIIKRFDSKKITIDVVDIDNKSLETLQMLLKHVEVPESVTINYICDDFLTHTFAVEKYDYIIGNPPFGKLTNRNLGKLQTYRKSAINTETNNICSFFLDKAVRMGTIVALVLPKAVLNIPEFTQTRAYLEKMCVKAILDFGEKGFKGVLVETIALVIEAEKKSWATEVYSMTNSKVIEQRQNYIFDNKLPYWVIYRDDFFDSIYDRLEFDVFSVFRDRQITNAKLNRSGDIRVLKSRNINDDGTEIIDVDGYDAYIDVSEASELSVYKFLDSTTVYLTPNMTYNPRVMKKPANTLVNGSVAILKPKVGCAPTKKQLLYFSTEEYRRFYKIARNFQTRSLNVDSCSVYFFGLLKEGGKLCLG